MFINTFLVGKMVWLGFDAQENLTLLHLNNKGADQPAQPDQRLIAFAIHSTSLHAVSIFNSSLLSILKARCLEFQNCNCNFEALEGFLEIQGYWPKVKRDTGYFYEYWKGYGILGINFRVMGIQCFLNLWDICHIYFRDMGYLSK